MKQLIKRIRPHIVKYLALALALLLLVALVMPLTGCANTTAKTEATTTVAPTTAAPTKAPTEPEPTEPEVTEPFDIPDYDPKDFEGLMNPMDNPPEDPYAAREPFYERRAEIDPQFFIDGIKYWEEVALHGEFDAYYDGYVKKWKEPLNVAVTGEPGEEDRATLERLVMQLNSLGLIPEITLQDEENADTNVTVYYDTLPNILENVDGARADNWGMFFFWWYDTMDRLYEMRNSFIYIATDVTDQEARNHLIQEEFIQQLGLINDSFDYYDSIFQQKWTTFQHPNEMDWLLVEMMYRPEITPNMKTDEALQTLADIYLDYLK